MLKLLMIGGVAALCGISLAAPANREPLAKTPFFRLPLGSVKPTAWLRTQLELQRDGLTGHAEELYEDIGQSDWISDKQQGGQFAWERGPYYAKGLIALAYVLDDPVLKERSRKWVDRVLASQQPSGDFGPRPYNWWANMIVMHYLRDVYEVTGDERIPPFLARYFDFQLKTLPQHTLAQDSVWAKARGGDIGPLKERIRALNPTAGLMACNHDPTALVGAFNRGGNQGRSREEDRRSDGRNR